MNTLNSYGYNDGDNSLLSLKMKQQAIDNAQDKKINNLSKQSGGDALKVFVDPNNHGPHTNLTKQEAIALLNISEGDFDRLMNGEFDKVLFVSEGTLGAAGGAKAEAKTVFNVAYEKVIREEGGVKFISGGSIIFGPGDPFYFGLSVQAVGDIYTVNVVLG